MKLMKLGLAVMFFVVGSLRPSEEQFSPGEKILEMTGEDHPIRFLVKPYPDGRLGIASVDIWNEDLGDYVTIDDPKAVAEAVKESDVAQDVPEAIADLMGEFATSIRPPRHKHLEVDDDDIYG